MNSNTEHSLVRFWGWTENKREEDLDFVELSQHAREGKPLYGESHQPLWVQGAAHRNSAFSQLKFCMFYQPSRELTADPLVSSSRIPNVCYMSYYPESPTDFLIFRFNLVNHPYHGTDPAKYGVSPPEDRVA